MISLQIDDFPVRKHDLGMSKKQETQVIFRCFFGYPHAVGMNQRSNERAVKDLSQRVLQPQGASEARFVQEGNSKHPKLYIYIFN